MTGKTLHLSRIRQSDPVVAIFNIALFALFVAGAVAATQMSFALRMLPLTVCLLGIAICLALFVRFLMAPEKTPEAHAEDEADVLSTFDGKAEASDLASLRHGGWMLAYVVALWLTGLWLSTIVFTAAFLRIEYRAGLRNIVIVTAITLATAYALGRLLNVTWPAGFLPF